MLRRGSACVYSMLSDGVSCLAALVVPSHGWLRCVLLICRICANESGPRSMGNLETMHD